MRCDGVRLAEVWSNKVRLDGWKINVVTGREPWLD